MLYVGKKVEATRYSAGCRWFACKCCGHEQDCVVVGVGQGSGNNPYFLDPHGATQRASASAQADADKDVEHVLRLASCPKCGKKSPSAVRSFWALWVLKMLGLVAFMLCVPTLVYALENKAAVWWIFGVVWLVAFPVIVHYDLVRKWMTIDGRIHFIDPNQDDAAGSDDLQLAEKEDWSF